MQTNKMLLYTIIFRTLTFISIVTFALSCAMLALLTTSGDTLVNVCGAFAIVTSFIVMLSLAVPLIIAVIIRNTTSAVSRDGNYVIEINERALGKQAKLQRVGTSFKLVNTYYSWSLWKFLVFACAFASFALFTTIAVKRSSYRGVTITGSVLSALLAFSYIVLERSTRQITKK